MSTDTEKKFLQMFNFVHIKVKQTQFEYLAQFFINYKHCYAASKLDVVKTKLELNLPLIATAVFKKLRAFTVTRTSTSLNRHTHTHLDLIVTVKTDSLTTVNTCFIPLIILKKQNHLKLS